MLRYCYYSIYKSTIHHHNSGDIIMTKKTFILDNILKKHDPFTTEANSATAGLAEALRSWGVDLDNYEYETTYRGVQGACRCGCCGTYSVPGENGFKRNLSTWQKLYAAGKPGRVDLFQVKDPKEFCVDYDYETPAGNPKCLTIYFTRKEA